MKARIRRVAWENPVVLSFVLEPLAGERFPAFTAGSHVSVNLRPGLVRSYSLMNDPADTDRYEIGVQLDENSRGGSLHIHEQWRAGELLEISEPANHFPLQEVPAHSILIGGGIGITPLLSMIARLKRLDRSWELHYACRHRERQAFLDRLAGDERVHLYLDDDPSVGAMDLRRILEASPDDAHLYCCGPQGMLDAYRQGMAGREERAHFEYFSSDIQPAMAGGFALRLVRRKKTIAVEPGETMLDALLNANIDIPFACSQGICGTCRVGVVEGIPDHRDQFLSEAEKSANNCVMVCCSGSRSTSLALDL